MLMFDIETNGLLKEVTVLHCMCVYDTETKKMYRFSFLTLYKTENNLSANNYVNQSTILIRDECQFFYACRLTILK